jgi:hypothetical protein
MWRIVCLFLGHKWFETHEEDRFGDVRIVRNCARCGRQEWGIVF